VLSSRCACARTRSGQCFHDCFLENEINFSQKAGESLPLDPVEGHKETGESSISTNLVRFGPYQVDRRAGEVRKHNQRIRLSGQPFEVLSLLLERPGEVVTREEMRQRLWTGNTFVDFEHSLNSAVKKLRRALNDNPDNPHYIETLPRKGYRFIGTIEPPKAASLIPAELLGPAAGAGPVAFDAGLMTDLPSPGAAADVTTGMPSASPRRAWTLAGAVGFLVALAMVLGSKKTATLV